MQTQKVYGLAEKLSDYLVGQAQLQAELLREEAGQYLQRGHQPQAQGL